MSEKELEPEMSVPCRECSDGPFGFAGHFELLVRTVGDGRISLRCRRCGTIWARTLVHEGAFVWAAITARMAQSPQMGIPIPPLPQA